MGTVATAIDSPTALKISRVEEVEVNVQPEQGHLVVSIPPKYAVSQYMGFLKGKLALQLFDRYPHLRKRYWGQHVWSRGYYVSTLGLDEERNKKGCYYGKFASSARIFPVICQLILPPKQPYNLARNERKD